MTHSKRYLYFITFISGMCVMAVELTASRIMAPYFGTSHYVWTNIIAVILAALALGYALGGKLSEKSPKIETLLGIIAIAAIFLLIVPVVVPLFGEKAFMSLLATRSPMYSILFQSFLATTLIFFIPIMLLGMVSPFIIKLFSMHEQAMGDVSGKVFAVGTVGSFLGTFLPAVVTIPAIGSKRTIVLFAFIMFATAAIGLARKKMALAIIPFAATSLDGRLPTLSMGRIIAEKESSYQYIKVVERDDLRFLQFNESTAVQSAYRQNKPLSSTAAYYDAMSYTPELVTKRPLKVLNIGLAGGTVARNIKDLYGDEVEVTGVEIDPEVIKLGQEYLALDRPGINIVVDDGRMFLQRTDERYDLIIVDAYSNQLTIPFHLATQEFFKLVSERLAPEGVVVMNVNDISAQGRILSSIGKTLLTVFPEVQSAHIEGALNYLVIAGKNLNPISMSDTKLGPEELRKAAIATAKNFEPIGTANGELLTDDRAPIEKMADSMIWRYYRGIK